MEPTQYDRDLQNLMNDVFIAISGGKEIHEYGYAADVRRWTLKVENILLALKNELKRERNIMPANKNEITRKVESAEGVAFELDIVKVGEAFVGKMMANGDKFHVSHNQARTLDEVYVNFEIFKSGFLKAQKLIAEGPVDGFRRDEERITFKEARILGGVHLAVLAERMGISMNLLKRLENGEAKQGVKFEAALTHFRETRINGLLLDHIDWSLAQQKNHHLAK